MIDPDAALAELEREESATRRLLERVPEDRLEWRPHERAMSLGQLALHVARIPGDVGGMLGPDAVPAPDFGSVPTPGSRAEILEALDEAMAAAREAVGSLDAASISAPVRLTANEQEVASMPRGAVLRFILLNHWYHHRGQLALHLRMLDVEVPATYGASADEVRLGSG